MLTYPQLGPTICIWGQFHMRYLNHESLKSAWNLLVLSMFLEGSCNFKMSCLPCHWQAERQHYIDVIMGAIASQITSLTIVYSTVYSGADKKDMKAPRYWSPANFPQKWPVTRKMLPFDDVIIVEVWTYICMCLYEFTRQVFRTKWFVIISFSIVVSQIMFTMPVHYPQNYFLMK